MEPLNIANFAIFATCIRTVPLGSESAAGRIVRIKAADDNGDVISFVADSSNDAATIAQWELFPDPSSPTAVFIRSIVDRSTLSPGPLPAGTVFVFKLRATSTSLQSPLLSVTITVAGGSVPLFFSPSMPSSVSIDENSASGFVALPVTLLQFDARSITMSLAIVSPAAAAGAFSLTGSGTSWNVKVANAALLDFESAALPSHTVTVLLTAQDGYQGDVCVAR